MKKILLALIVCLWACRGEAAYAITVHTGAISTNNNDVTTAAINTSGSDLIVLCASSNLPGSAATVSDNKGNTYTGLAITSVSNTTQLFYVQAPTVGAGHTFTVTATSHFPAVTVAAFSGSTSTPFDVENGNNQAGGTTLQPGTVTPSVANELVVTGTTSDLTVTASISAGFTLTDNVPGDGAHAFGSGLAYQIQTTATGVNPMWTYSSAATTTARIASFKAGAGGTPAARPCIIGGGLICDEQSSGDEVAAPVSTFPGRPHD